MYVIPAAAPPSVSPPLLFPSLHPGAGRAAELRARNETKLVSWSPASVRCGRSANDCVVFLSWLCDQAVKAT